MQKVSNTDSDLRILVTAPTGKDSRLIAELLSRTGMPCFHCNTLEAACAELDEGAGVLLISEEALNPQGILDLSEKVENQPSWSDLPIVLLTLGGEVSSANLRRRRLRLPLGNLLLLERPVRPETLISTVEGALRARRRQYEIRDFLHTQRQSEAALRQSEKLAVAGRLAASIAHEINNPLESVTNLLYLAKNSESLDQIKTYVGMAERELSRVSEICTQTLKFHRQSNRATAVNVAEVLQSVLALYAPRLHSADIEVVQDFGDLQPVFGFSGELRQVFANLIGNSLDAMRSGGKLHIRAHTAEEFRNGHRRGVRVFIADTGSGIPEEVRLKIFEPFVSTKGNLGTGLGLWVSKGIIEKHGGNVRMKSRAEGKKRGTVFSVFLPCEVSSSEIAVAG